MLSRLSAANIKMYQREIFGKEEQQQQHSTTTLGIQCRKWKDGSQGREAAADAVVGGT